MLDELGLAEQLELTSTMELFSSSSQLVYTTSILPHAVFFRKQNFNGCRPSVLDIPRLNDPLIIPLGVNVNNVISYLINHNLLNIKNLVTGFPHPSGGNGHRHQQFRENKEEMKRQIKEYFKK